MIYKILSEIKDANDFLTTVSLFKEIPLTKEECDALLKIYARYQSEAAGDPDFLKFCLAVDILACHTSEDDDFFAGLQLNDATLAALLTAQKIVSVGWAVDSADSADTAAAIAARVQDESASLPARVVLARIALDAMTESRNFAKIQEQVRALASFLTGCGTEVLDRYTDLVTEVRKRCRQ